LTSKQRESIFIFRDFKFLIAVCGAVKMLRVFKTAFSAISVKREREREFLHCGLHVLFYNFIYNLHCIVFICNDFLQMTVRKAGRRVVALTPTLSLRKKG